MSAVDLDPGAFWRLTPRELSLVFKAASERHVRERNERTTQAYFTAVIPLMKKTPKLDTLLVSAAPKNQQTPDQQLAIAKSWMASRRTKRR